MALKQENTQIIDTPPDEVLSERVQYLRQVEQAAQEKARLSLRLKTILLEDKKLLGRLTQ